MEVPSKNWQKVHRATLERAQRTAIEPLVPLYTIYAGVCASYLVGLLRFRFYDHSADFTWFTAAQLVIVAIAGILVPVLTGSVLTLHFTHLKMNRLGAE